MKPLSSTLESQKNRIDDAGDVVERTEALRTPRGRVIAEKSKAFACSLVSLVVLVQNRRKGPGNNNIRVNGSLVHLYSYTSKIEPLLRGNSNSGVDHLRMLPGPDG